MNRRRYTGRRLFWPVVMLFVVFAISFIVFQQSREKEYKVEQLSLRLQDYNNQMAEALGYIGSATEAVFDHYVRVHPVQDIRVTVIDRSGHVVYDNRRKDYSQIESHANRKEFREALRRGYGTDIARASETTGDKYFYSANYYPKLGLVIRTALPYNDNLYRQLATDQHYIWFAIAITLLLVFVLYRFIRQLGRNITNLRHFARRAETETLELSELADFPNDELGEISEHIVKLFMQLEKTRREQDVLKRQLTQNAAHELKTPVASIMGYLETILTNPNLTEGQRQRFLEGSYAQAKRLAALVDDISTLNRLDDAPDVHHFQSVDVSSLVARMVEELRPQLENKKMKVENGLPEKLMVEGNKGLIYSIFRNLFDNAIAYAGEGVTVSLEYNNGVFTFQDNGVGVGEEHLQRLFERFYRVDKGRSRKLGGTGLGLAIVKNAVLIHGGSISVGTNRPHGLRFEFRLTH